MPANKLLNLVNVTSRPRKHQVSCTAVPYAPRLPLCLRRVKRKPGHDNAEYGLPNGIHRTAGITVGATELTWFDMDGACRGKVDLSIRSVETLPESQSLAHLMDYQILINLDNFGDPL